MTGDETPDVPEDQNADCEVGYKRPPVRTQFKPGISGNPKGRPRGARNKPKPPSEERLQDIILEEAYRAIPVRDGDGTVEIPMAQAIIRSLAVNAAKGQARAQVAFTQLLTMTERSRRADREALIQAAIEYKQSWEAYLEWRERTGSDGPDPLPHPDHVHINPRTGEVLIKGPATPEEKAQHDEWCAKLEDWREEVTFLRGVLHDPDIIDTPHGKAMIETDIAMARHTVSMIEALVAYDFERGADIAWRWKNERITAQGRHIP